MKIGFRTASAIILLSGLTACNQAAPPPEQVIVERQVIHEAPPPPRQEVIVAPPGPPERYAWDPGRWNADGHQFQWHGGNWIPRQDPHRAWVPAHWTHTATGWVQAPGVWR